MIKLLNPTDRRERRQLYKLVHESQRFSASPWTAWSAMTSRSRS
ncbi:MAG TPA: hypothetical protein VLI05_06730 [Candidatus Saccharimonadia bacterium]|nr:hypothetical protein [Candidatus Saccharimonadia bacterium]